MNEGLSDMSSSLKFGGIGSGSSTNRPESSGSGTAPLSQRPPGSSPTEMCGAYWSSWRKNGFRFGA